MGEAKSPYVLERIRLFKEKERIVKKMLANKALAAQEYAHVQEEVNDKLRAMNLGDVSDTWLRNARHKARAEHGLPFDGIESPENNFALRRKVALDIAREHHGDIAQEKLQALVRERMGGGPSIGSPTASKIIRQVQRETSKGIGVVPQPPPLPPFRTPIQRENGAVAAEPGVTLSPDARAALSLTAEALYREGIVTLTLSINPDGKASYIAEKRTISEVKGSI